MRRKHWGWGFEEEWSPSVEAAAGLAEHLGFGSVELEAPARVELPPPRVEAPSGLPVAADDHARALHAHGASYGDVVRAFRGEFPFVPDFVARPSSESDLARVLEWCADASLAVTPYGGGTSVVGGVDPRLGPGHAGAVSVDLGALDRVLELDDVSRAARVQAGASGPRLEEQLGERGMTMRFFPQSFQHSTLGGWIATRAAGHFATGPTHVDDLVESVRAVTVSGEVWESRRLPASGAGPSPDRMLLGSEGTLAVITAAWVRVRPRPSARRSASVTFPSFALGCDAVRAILQSGLRPANCRLVSAAEAALTFTGSSDVLLLGFEDDVSGFEPAVSLCVANGGQVREGGGGGSAAWRDAFLRAPYLRDTFVAMGVLSETFETAVTWDRLPDLVSSVHAAVLDALHGAGSVTCRLTHAYPDGAAPYFTVLAPASRGSEVEQWAAIKAVASDAVLAAGGTITHHHAVGRDHRRWYDAQRPEPFASAWRAAKSALDPSGILNPGVLWDQP
jgi:alkyldihydroxyacetonephosphate synthase